MATFSSCLEVFEDGSRGLWWFTSIAHSLKHIVAYNHKVPNTPKVVFLMLHTTCVIVKIRAVKIQRRMTLSMTTFIVKLRGYFLSVGLKRKSILCKVKVALTCSGNTFTHCTSSVVTTAMTSEMPWRVNWNQGVVLL